MRACSFGCSKIADVVIIQLDNLSPGTYNCLFRKKYMHIHSFFFIFLCRERAESDTTVDDASIKAEKFAARFFTFPFGLLVLLVRDRFAVVFE